MVIASRPRPCAKHAFERQCAACRDDESYMQTNGSSRYQHDPEYGGKVSLSGFQNAKAASPPGLEHLPPMPPDHPRVRELIGSEAAAR